MTIDDIQLFDWTKNITGIAAICGINQLACIDLDKVKNKNILSTILQFLKLPPDYQWVVKTHSGYHIWFKLNDKWKLFDYIGQSFAYKKFFPKDYSALKHIELRVKNCYTLLPDSIHKDGGKYKFVNTEPSALPAYVEPENIQHLLSKLFSLTNRREVKKISAAGNWKPDIKYLPAAIKFLKEFRLDYDTWRDCCFALCSLGEEGRKYFVELSLNKFYPGDTKQFIDKQFSQCLQRYNDDKMKLNTLFHYAKSLGFVYGKNIDSLSKVMLTFPLCLMQCSDEELIPKILSYSLIRYLSDDIDKEKESRKITADTIRKILIKHKIDFITAEQIISGYKSLNEFVLSYEKQFGTDAYSLVGLDFILETYKGEIKYDTFRIYNAIKAFLGRVQSYKIIHYDRIKAGVLGYKKRSILEECNCNYVPMHTATIYRRIKILVDKKFFAKVHYGRCNYYSTKLSDKELQKAVAKLLKKREQKKLQNPANTFAKQIKKMKSELRENMVKNSDTPYLLS